MNQNFFNGFMDSTFFKYSRNHEYQSNEFYPQFTCGLFVSFNIKDNYGNKPIKMGPFNTFADHIHFTLSSINFYLGHYSQKWLLNVPYEKCSFFQCVEREVTIYWKHYIRNPQIIKKRAVTSWIFLYFITNCPTDYIGVIHDDTCWILMKKLKYSACE